MKKRSSVIISIVLLLGIIFTLISCGESVTTRTATKTEASVIVTTRTSTKTEASVTGTTGTSTKTEASVTGTTGKPVTYSAGLKYELNSDPKTYSVAGIGTCKDKDIVIPPEYNGLPVTNIRNSAFSGCSSLTSISIPNSVKSIENRAFGDCSSLESITVSSGNIKYHSAGNCLIDTANKTLILGCKNSIIPTDGSVTSIGSAAFSGCRSLTSIVIPDSVTIIMFDAFWGCRSLTSIVIPDSVTIICSYAFLGCDSLTSVVIGNSVVRIGGWAFAGCSKKLESITVSSENMKYHSAGNCLIDTSNKTLILGCKKSIIPTDSSVSSIGYEAFLECRSLTNIVIPDNVTSIGNSAFSRCSSLTSISIPGGVTSIGDGAFYDCSSLTSINFAGTKAQWRAIEKGGSWNLNTGHYTIHCTDGDIKT